MTYQVHRWVWISIVALTACNGGDVGGKAAPMDPAEPVKPADPAPATASATKTVYFDVHELGAGKATANVAAEEHAKAMAATDKTVAFSDYWVDEKNGRIIHVATGPSLAAVTAAHVAAHGATPGKVMELIEAPDRRQPAGGKKLFLDAHHNPPGTVIKVEDIIKGHERELTIQGKHNVDFVSWWLEPSTGTIMCLAETDDPKGAVASHQETDGDLADEMAEVTPGP
jgi:hypothetical protein